MRPRPDESWRRRSSARREEDAEDRLEFTSQRVVLPSSPWDGDLAGPRPTTAVNVRALGDVAESVVSKLQAMRSGGDLDVALSDGADELFVRYVATMRPGQESVGFAKRPHVHGSGRPGSGEVCRTHHRRSELWRASAAQPAPKAG